MLNPIRMSKVVITGSRRTLDETVQTLYDLKLVHLDDYKTGKYKDAEGYFDIGTPFERAGKFSDELVRTRVLMDNLGVEKTTELVKEEPTNASAKLLVEEQKFAGIAEKRKDLQDQLNYISNIEEPLAFLDSVGLDSEIARPTETLGVISGSMGKDPEKIIKTVTKDYEIFTGKDKKKTNFVVFVDKENVDKIREKLF